MIDLQYGQNHKALLRLALQHRLHHTPVEESGIYHMIKFIHLYDAEFHAGILSYRNKPVSFVLVRCGLFAKPVWNYFTKPGYRQRGFMRILSTHVANQSSIQPTVVCNQYADDLVVAFMNHMGYSPR